MAIEIGLKGKKEFTVQEKQLASAIGSGLVSVFATPMMIAEIENTAAESLQPFLDEGKTTVGTEVNVKHTAATPLGMKVRVETEVIEVAAGGKLITFKAAVFDEKEQVGEGTHQRAIVDKARFESKVNAKK